MKGSDERDRSLERLLRQSLAAPHQGATDACLDAETVAAWSEGGLSGAALEMAERHAAGCARCQALLGDLVRTAVANPAPRRWLAWLVPLTAAAAAMAIWIAVPRDRDAPAEPVAEVQGQSADARASAPPSPSEATGAPAPAASGASSDLAAAAPGAQPPAAPAPPALARERAQARAANTLAETVAVASVIVSPEPAVRWRLAGSIVERSADGGTSWTAVANVPSVQLVAGSAPSASVCWVVGRAGVVLRSTDGRTFVRALFPEPLDLSGVRASDAQHASVTTVDGRVFSTTDGGATWAPDQL